MDNKQQAIEALKYYLYKSRRNINEQIDVICSEFGIEKTAFIEEFEKDTGVTPAEYGVLVVEANKEINEDLSDFAADKVARLGNYLGQKFGFGGVKARAQAQQDNRNRMQDLFNNWHKVAAGAKLEPDDKSLKTFLLAQGVPNDVIMSTMKQYRNKFQSTVATNPTKPTNTTGQPSTAANPNPQPSTTGTQPTQGTTGTAAAQPVVQSKVNYGKAINEALLPTNELRNFFLTIAQAENAYKLKNQAAQAAQSAPSPAVKKVAKAAPAAIPAPTTPVQPAPQGSGISNQAAKQAAKVQQTAVPDKQVDPQEVSNYIAKMNSKNKIDFINKSIVQKLSNEEIKELFQQIMLNKKNNPAS
jgi:hypothetical protein